ncbi:MAG: tRNA lysidine(34) synthetase TilS, partial [Bacteroidetes bacterium]|nr:tRNA lysidine(34) synthetase TilS [Bacteroidota bacterium]
MSKIISTLKNELKIPIKSTLILSVSGGVDSMVMLSILRESPYKLVVVHFNHLKRDASVIEKDLVESYCQKYEIPFHYYTISIKSGNFHHKAHQMRMHYLNEAATLNKTPYILTAHHLDDLFENVLIKLTRGSNLLGYAGMQMMYTEDPFIYIKPLLYTSKEEIIEYAEANKVPFLVDESNEENNYLRNRYRHAIVPIMKQENEQLLDQIKHYHSQITHAFDFIRKTTKTLINDDLIIHISQYKTCDEAIKDDMVAYVIEQHDLPLSNESIQKIKKML